MNQIKKNLCFLVIVCILFTNNSQLDVVAATNSLIYETLSTENIASGLTYEKKTKLTTDGWVDIHVLKMDLKNEYIQLDVLRSDKGWGFKDFLTNMANEDSQVVAGINASFFDMSKNPTQSFGTEFDGEYAQIRNGYNMNSNGYANLVQTSDQMLIDFFGANIQFSNNLGRTMFITGINKTENLNQEVIIFNRVAMNDSTQIEALAKIHKIVVLEGVVQGVYPPGIVATIPENGYLISIPETIALTHLSHYPLGTSVSLVVTNNLNLENIETAIAGSGLIIKNGSFVQPTSVVVEPNKRHPRTAVGLTADGQYLIAMVVDGRRDSIGATHSEMAQYFNEYNVINAMHFDGGGSSTMVAETLFENENVVMNTVSDGSQRKIVNGVGFVSTAPMGDIQTIRTVPSETRAFAGSPITFEVFGYDAYEHKIPLTQSQIIWDVTGVQGSFNGNIFTPISSGKAQITCRYQHLTTTSQVISVDQVMGISIKPSVLQLQTLQSGSYTVTGTDLNGYEINIPKEKCNWIIEDTSIAYTNQGMIFANSISGNTKVSLQISGVSAYAYLTVGTEISLLSSLDGITVTPMSYPEALVTTAKLSTTQVLDGAEAVELGYAFNISEETQAAYAVLSNVSIPKGVQAIGINAYGNNSGLLLKGLVNDANGNVHYLSFSTNIDFNGWKYLEAKTPTDAVYPLQLTRLYVASLKTPTPLQGTVYFDKLMQINGLNISNIQIPDAFWNDSLQVTPTTFDTKISVFGATSGKNSMLDDVVLRKVYEDMKTSNIDIYAGFSGVNQQFVDSGSIIWNDTFSVKDSGQVRIINLATSKGGLLDTNASQITGFLDALNSTTQSNIIIIANKNPSESDSFNQQREGDFVHQILSDYQSSSHKNIFFVNASGYEMEQKFFEGIRYIDLNGLWVKKAGNQVDLTESFYMLNFYLNGSQMQYSIDSIYKP